MTRKEAIQILIQAGSRDIQGSGLGYRSNTEEYEKHCAEEIKKEEPKP